MKIKELAKKILKNPHKALKFVNILYLSLLLIYLLATIIDLNTGTKPYYKFWCSFPLVILITLSCWCSSASVFAKEIEKQEEKRK